MMGEGCPLGSDLRPTIECLREMRRKGKKGRKKKTKKKGTEEGKGEEEVAETSGKEGSGGEGLREVEASEESSSSDLVPATVIEVSLGLMNLHGVGQKVADCVSLFGLSCHDAVPCDTHVFQMAARWDQGLAAMQRKAKEGGKAVAVTRAVHEKVGTVFREKFPGGYAGWAQTVLFCLELPSFKEANANTPEKKGERGGEAEETRADTGV